MGGFSDISEDDCLDWLLGGSDPTRPTGRYIALYSAAPTDAGGGTEITGGSFPRVAAAFAAASGGSTNPTAEVTFSTVPSDLGDAVAFGVFDAPTGGNLRAWAMLNTAKSLETGDIPFFAPEDLTISLD